MHYPIDTILLLCALIDTIFLEGTSSSHKLYISYRSFIWTHFLSMIFTTFELLSRERSSCKPICGSVSFEHFSLYSSFSDFLCVYLGFKRFKYTRLLETKTNYISLLSCAFNQRLLELHFLFCLNQSNAVSGIIRKYLYIH